MIGFGGSGFQVQHLDALQDHRLFGVELHIALPRPG